MPTHSCAVSGQKFDVNHDESEFYNGFSVPPPKLCPSERQRRRMAFINFRTLCYRKCSATSQRVLSMYDEKAPFPVYSKEYWWSDNWNAANYGRAYDFSRTFFENYHELAKAVPRFSIMNTNSENCHYSNFTFNANNCYLVFGCVDNEDCLYGHIVWSCKFCLDCLYAFRCEWCSNCVDVVDSYNLHYSRECNNCRDSYFLYDCNSCQNCFACNNLRNKQYCFYNEQLSKAEYHERLHKFFPLNWQACQTAKEWLSQRVSQHAIFPELFGFQYEEVSGNHLYECKQCFNCFDLKRCENVRYSYTGQQLENCFDISFTGAPARYCLDSLTLFDCERVCFSHALGNCHDAAYSEFCNTSHDIFGCLGLRSTEYCILNRAYSKHEYEKLVKQIRSQMEEAGELGEFFPMQLSPFPYNQSIAHEYMPLSKAEVLGRGLRWGDLTKSNGNESSICSDQSSLDAKQDDVLQKTFCCEESGKGYRIQASELEICRRLKLPLPRLCPDLRHEKRMRERAPRRLFTSNCHHCKTPILTAHNERQGAGRYCKGCYLKV